MARQVKKLYGDACQVCGTRVVGESGRTYSEGAHVKPLGRPHLGPDVMTNLLCLCPNHHTQLDIGGMLIEDDMTVVGVDGQVFGQLTFEKTHRLDPANVAYHQGLWRSRK